MVHELCYLRGRFAHTRGRDGFTFRFQFVYKVIYFFSFGSKALLGPEGLAGTAALWVYPSQWQCLWSRKLCCLPKLQSSKSPNPGACFSLSCLCISCNSLALCHISTIASPSRLSLTALNTFSLEESISVKVVIYMRLTFSQDTVIPGQRLHQKAIIKSRQLSNVTLSLRLHKIQEEL